MLVGNLVSRFVIVMIYVTNMIVVIVVIAGAAAEDERGSGPAPHVRQVGQGRALRHRHRVRRHISGREK
jgi:hypothetical protein